MPSDKPRIQLYADECFPVTSATYLKSLGVSIIHAYDKNFVQRSDRFHLQQSKKLKRVLITLDRDFNDYEEAPLRGYPGVIIISVPSATTLNVNNVCKKAFKYLTVNFVKEALVKVTNSKIIKMKEGKKTEKLM